MTEPMNCPTHGTSQLVQGVDGTPRCLACVHNELSEDLLQHCFSLGDDDDN